MAEFTPIRILRSANIAPPTVVDPKFPMGSLAYSYDKINDGASGKLYFHAVDSLNNPQVHVIGGKQYTDIIDASTNLNTPDTLVLRDANGNFQGNVIGSASYLNPGFDLSLSGDLSGNIFIDASQNVVLDGQITDSGVVAGTYGGASHIPTFVVGLDGRLTQAANVAIITDIGIAGEVGNATIATGDTIRFEGDSNLDTAVTGNLVQFTYTGTHSVVGTPNEIEVNTTSQVATISLPTELIVPGNMSVMGNMHVRGNTTIVDSVVLSSGDSLIKLANGNTTSDLIDSGFYSVYNNGSGVTHTGLVRVAADGKYYVLDNISIDPVANVITGGDFAELTANITGGYLYDLVEPIDVKDGGLGVSTLAANTVIIGNGVNPVNTITGSDGQVLLYKNGEPVIGDLDGGEY